MSTTDFSPQGTFDVDSDWHLWSKCCCHSRLHSNGRLGQLLKLDWKLHWTIEKRNLNNWLKGWNITDQTAHYETIRVCMSKQHQQKMFVHKIRETIIAANSKSLESYRQIDLSKIQNSVSRTISMESPNNALRYLSEGRQQNNPSVMWSSQELSYFLDLQLGTITLWTVDIFSAECLP